jgi:hypothetical protein
MTGRADPQIIVAPGPQGPLVSWQYRCEGCGAQELVDTSDQARSLAEQHNIDTHGGSGEVTPASIGAV